MRYLLSWYSFVCWLSMWGCVSFWVEANSFTDWDWGDTLPFEWKQIRFPIEKWGCVPFWIEADSFACSRLSGFVRFWVEANSFTDWDWGDALPLELKQIRLLIEYAGMRSLLSRSKFFWWLSMCGCVPFWVEANSFADWDWGDALPFELKQIRLLIDYVGMRSLLSGIKFVS